VNHLKSMRLLLVLLIVTAASSVAAESCLSIFSSQIFSVQPLPESAILIALGLDSPADPLEGFAQSVEKQLHRRVVIYREFEGAHYISQSGKWWDGPREQSTAIVEQAIHRAVALYPNKKILAFNLDGFDLKRLYRADGTEIFSFTNFEVHLLLHDHHLFLATRWYLKGKELNSEEIEKFFAPLKTMNL